MAKIQNFNVNKKKTDYITATPLNKGIITADDKVRLDALWQNNVSGGNISDVHVHIDGNVYVEEVKNTVDRLNTEFDEIKDLVNNMTSCDCASMFDTIATKEWTKTTINEKVNLTTPPHIGLGHRHLHRSVSR